jgi:TrmH family RNA methyltransferase
MITSLSNNRVKQVVALQSRRQARRKASRFVVEGPRLLRDAVLARAPIEEVFYTESFAADPDSLGLLDGLSKLGAMLSIVDEAVMNAMADTETPQGVIGVSPFIELEVPDDLDFALVIDAVADPGNLGTIMRAAAAAGVHLLISTVGTVDIYNPKVVRSAIGAHFRLPVRYRSWDGVAGLLEGHVLFLASSSGGAPYFDVDWTQRSALIVSDEAHGASEDALRVAHAHVTIPMPGGMESLNVAMATSILLFERVRQYSQFPR